MHYMTIDYTVYMYVQTERGFDQTPKPLLAMCLVCQLNQS